MKRRVVLLLLLLVAGAIVNVAVAWGIAMKRQGKPIMFAERPLNDSYVAWWRANAPSDWDEQTDWIIGATQPGREITDFLRRKTLRNMTAATRIRCGWPVVSMERSIWTSQTGRVHSNDSWVVYGGSPYLEVPLRPVARGFAINTVVYAAILTPLFLLPFALQRRRRIKRGLCPKCAYDLRNRPSDSAVCPEGGATMLNAA